jgi:hypothetical protein
MNRYVIQIGRNKSKYSNKWSFDNLNQAIMWYNGLNIWNGYKKRILDRTTNKVIERYIS